VWRQRQAGVHKPSRPRDGIAVRTACRLPPTASGRYESITAAHNTIEALWLPGMRCRYPCRRCREAPSRACFAFARLPVLLFMLAWRVAVSRWGVGARGSGGKCPVPASCKGACCAHGRNRDVPPQHGMGWWGGSGGGVVGVVLQGRCRRRVVEGASRVWQTGARGAVARGACLLMPVLQVICYGGVGAGHLNGEKEWVG